MTSRPSCAAVSSASTSNTCPRRRTQKDLVAVVVRPRPPDLDVCWRAYLRRFDIEHTFRFVKNTLAGRHHRCRSRTGRPLDLARLAAYTQLRLARRPRRRPPAALGAAMDPTTLTPARVRRGFRLLRASLGTPASPPKSVTPGPGRPKGTETAQNPLSGRQKGCLNRDQGLIAS